MNAIKYLDLGINPESGLPRRRYLGMMTDQEITAATLGLAVNDDLDAGTRKERASDVQEDLWEGLGL